MKHLVTFSFVLLSLIVNAQKQKVDVKDDQITVDGIPYAIIEKTGSPSQDFSVKSLEGKELIYLKFEDYNHSSKVTSGNPQGRETYFICTFLNDKQQCEVQPFMTKKGTAKMIVEYQLINDGEIDQEKENKMVLVNGNHFSEERKNLSGTTIIINNR